ncbi:MAG: hypothetical protein EOO47_05640 [Flavobacterium sp.]|nr:MAG: hypothetical protein EOO47_05640 [Flavobacterium sp.]
MQPIENEPKGDAENQRRNDVDLGSTAKSEKREVDDTQGDLAGNANANLPEEEKEDHEDESATDENVDDSLTGDFAKPEDNA